MLEKLHWNKRTKQATTTAVAAGVGVIIGILDKFGAGKVIPKGKLASMTGEQIVDALMKAGKSNAAAAIGRRIVTATAGEAATETAQDAAIVASTAAMGGEYTGKELADRALESAVIGGTIGGGTRTAAETVNAAGRGVQAVLPDAGYRPQDAEAAADVAQRLQTVATENGLDLNNVQANDTDGARAAIDTVHSQLVSDIDQAYAALKPQLKAADGDSDQVAADKAAVARARKMAKTKTKNTVGKAEMDATQRLLGNTAEGQQLMRLFRQSNELTGLQTPDWWRPFPFHRRTIATSLTHRLLRPCVDRTTNKARSINCSSWFHWRCISTGTAWRICRWPCD